MLKNVGRSWVNNRLVRLRSNSGIEVDCQRGKGCKLVVLGVLISNFTAIVMLEAVTIINTLSHLPSTMDIVKSLLTNFSLSWMIPASAIRYQAETVRPFGQSQVCGSASFRTMDAGKFVQRQRTYLEPWIPGINCLQIYLFILSISDCGMFIWWLKYTEIHF